MVPFPRSSKAYWRERMRLELSGLTAEEAKKMIAAANRSARTKQAVGQQCTAKSRVTGQQCKAMALPSGKCYFHGGMSTGRQSAAGKAQAAEIGRRVQAERKRLRNQILAQMEEEEKAGVAESAPPPPAADGGEV